MFQNDPKMAKNDKKWGKMTKKPKWQTNHYGPKVPQNDVKWSKLTQNSPKSPKNDTN